jgi:hypothetical protein
MDLTIRYECENCGHHSSYKETYDETLVEGGYKSTKAAAQELARESSIKVQKLARETAEKWEKEGPESFRVQSTHQKCPNCGYTQSWMVDYLQHTQRVEKIRFPILFGSLAYILALFAFGIHDKAFLYMGDLAGLLEFVIWAAAVGIFYLSRKKSLDPNREFEDVSKVNEPTIIWGKATITQ